MTVTQSLVAAAKAEHEPMCLQLFSQKKPSPGRLAVCSALGEVMSLL